MATSAVSNVGSAQAPKFSPGPSSENYTVKITASGAANFEIEAPLPERFSLAMSANWDSPFARSASNAATGAAAAQVNKLLGNRANIGGDTIGQVMSAMGMPSRLKVESMQVWQDSSPFVISIPFVLIATDDPQSQIKDRVKNLLKLCAPTEIGGGLLVPPGPTATQSASGGGGTFVTVKLGNFLKMEKCVVKSVSADLESIIHTSGIPMIAYVNIEVESYYSSFTTNDIDAVM